MTHKLNEMQEKLAKMRHDLAQAFDQAGDNLDFSKVTAFAGTDEEKCAAIRKLSADCEKTAKEVVELHAMVESKAKNEREIEAAKAANRPAMPTKSEEKAERLSMGQAFVKAGGHLKENRGKEIHLPDGVSVKTLMERSAGWGPESLRSGRLVDYAVRPIQVIDILPFERTGQAALKYMEETTLTETNIVEKAEGAAFGEAALALTERSVTIEKIPGYLPVTDEQLEDVEQCAAYIDNRLGAMVMRRLDYQVINGSGVTPYLLGVLNKPSIQSTTAEAGDGNADTILRAIKNVRVTGRAIASAIILNPTDWLNERLRKTKDGAYVWGNPSEQGITSMWGLPVAQCDSLSAGTAVVGDFRVYSALVERRGLTMKVGYNTTDFIEGQQTIRADWRGAVVWYRAAAFSSVTLPA